MRVIIHFEEGPGAEATIVRPSLGTRDLELPLGSAGAEERLHTLLNSCGAGPLYVLGRLHESVEVDFFFGPLNPSYHHSLCQQISP